MPQMRLAGPLLDERTISNKKAPVEQVEPMIKAQQAVPVRRLPYDRFVDRAMRSKTRIPQDLMGGLLRYRLSALPDWAAQSLVALDRSESDAGGSK